MSPPKSVEVLLTGSKYKLDELNKTFLMATVDISDQRAGERILRLVETGAARLTTGCRHRCNFNLASISIRLEPLIDRQLDIEAKVEGHRQKVLKFTVFALGKNTVNVHGPSSHINALPKSTYGNYLRRGTQRVIYG
jgi:hypothetical protein